MPQTAGSGLWPSLATPPTAASDLGRGPCQGSVASADLLDLGPGQPGTQDPWAVPRSRLPHTTLVDVPEHQPRPLVETGVGGSRRLCGWTGQSVSRTCCFSKSL